MSSNHPNGIRVIMSKIQHRNMAGPGPRRGLEVSCSGRYEAKPIRVVAAVAAGGDSARGSD